MVKVVKVELIRDEGGTAVKVVAAGLELVSERIYNHAGRARNAARRLVQRLNDAAGAEIAAFTD